MNALVAGRIADAFEDYVELIGLPQALSAPTGSRTLPAVRGEEAWGANFRVMFSIGTGGTLYAPRAYAAWGPGATGSIITVLDDLTAYLGTPGETSPAPPSLVELDLSAPARIDHIRRHLSLTMTHLANIIGVTRTTLYAWQDSTASPRVQHQRRLGALADLATQWASRSTEPVGVYLVTPLAGGATLLDLLSARRWNARGISGAINAIAAAIEWTRGVRRAPDPFHNLRALIAERANASSIASPTGRRLVATVTSRPDEDREPDGMTWANMAAIGGPRAPEETEARRQSRRRRR